MENTILNSALVSSENFSKIIGVDDLIYLPVKFSTTTDIHVLRIEGRVDNVEKFLAEIKFALNVAIIGNLEGVEYHMKINHMPISITGTCKLNHFISSGDAESNDVDVEFFKSLQA